MATLAEHADGWIRLADEPPFAIGALEVTPALRQAAWPGAARTIEPRVMQVLVALGRTPGTIVSRDALVATCWGGRAVGENAIQRTISLLRHLAAESGAFEIETITKVGYRLLPRAGGDAALPPVQSAPAPIGEERRPDRRAVIAGVAVLAAASLGAFGFVARPDNRDEARALHAAGIDVQRRGGPDAFRQAARYFERATAADPRFADAWGDLAFAQLELLQNSDERGHGELMASIEASARRALRLDPGQRAALVTLALLRPPFRTWLASEKRLRETLARLPDEPLLRQRLGLLAADTGRWGAAAGEFARLAEREPLVPAYQRQLAAALWHGGRKPRAEAIVERAATLWPNDSWLWLLRFDMRLLGGRPAAALRMTERHATGLGGRSPLPFEVAVKTAEALIDRSTARAAAAETAILAARETGEIASFLAIPYLAALGRTEAAWQVAETYYLGARDPETGERRPLGESAWRRTDCLFTAAARPLRADARFARLTADLGLADYWRATGTRPDPITA